MPKYTPEQIYDAARALLSTLDAETRRQAEALLQQAERGQPTDRALLDLLTRQENTRRQLRGLLKGDGERLLGDYSHLTGEPGSTKPGDAFICPTPGCGYRYVITEAGETPPPCPKHQHFPVPAGETED